MLDPEQIVKSISKEYDRNKRAFKKKNTVFHLRMEI
jgi:hypothetical protein